MNERERIRQRVMTMVRESCADASCPIEPMLESCVDWAIDQRWPSPVSVFVPLLAVRDVQECIRQGSCTGLTEVTG